MSPHHGSARRADIAAHNEAFVDGVCHAIDTLELVLGDRAAAGRLLAALFVAAGPDTSPVPPAPPETAAAHTRIEPL